MLPQLKELEENYGGKRVLVTGGLGFIGSTLTEELLALGSHVTVVDNFLPDHGGNWKNIEPFQNHPHLRVQITDIRDHNAMNELCRKQDFVFHLAGQVNHILSLKDPFLDLDINILGTAALMEAIRKHCPQAKVIYTGTRGQYGVQKVIPVNEEAPTSPTGIYELSNLTAEKLIQIYYRTHGIASSLLRLTNVYGPRAQVKHPHFGVANWFVRLAVEGKPITLMGEGENIRDFLHVNDAVRGILMAGASETALQGEVINLGVDIPSNYKEVAEILQALSGVEVQKIPFSKERAAQEPGDFFSDISKARSLLKWEPTIGLQEGLQSYYEWLKLNLEDYINDSEVKKTA